MKKRRTWAAVLGLVSLVAIVQFLNGWPVMREVPLAPGVQGTPGGTSPMYPPPGASSEASYPIKSSWSLSDRDRTIRAYESGGDLKELYSKLVKEESAEPLGYARLVIDSCLPFAKSPSARLGDFATYRLDSSVPAARERNQALERLASRCKGFSDELSTGLIAEKVELGRRAKTQFDEIRSITGVNPDRKVLEGVIRSALASGDPYAILMLRDPVSSAFHASLTPEQRKAAREEPDTRYLAWALAACDLGMGCGKDDTSALRMCADFAACGDGVEAGLLRGLTKDQVARVLEQRALLRTAMREQDYAALLP